jgi:transposase-like protein
MVTEVYHCPICEKAEPVVRFGRTRSGTQRLWCRECRKSWTPLPKSRAVTPEKEKLILAALSERLSQRAIARTLKVSRDTIRQVLKRGHTQHE